MYNREEPQGAFAVSAAIESFQNGLGLPSRLLFSNNSSKSFPFQRSEADLLIGALCLVQLRR